MAATVLAIRRERPALSALSSQSFETSTPMHKGPATVERSVEADRRRATMGRFSQEGEGPLAQDCNSGWARPTVHAQDRKRQDDGSRLLANSCSIQNRSRLPDRHSYRRRKAAKEQPVNTNNPENMGALRSPGFPNQRYFDSTCWWAEASRRWQSRIRRTCATALLMR
jgi:hypothetical protein